LRKFVCAAWNKIVRKFACPAWSKMLRKCACPAWNSTSCSKLGRQTSLNILLQIRQANFSISGSKLGREKVCLPNLE
jgi:hypothetical protein